MYCPGLQCSQLSRASFPVLIQRRSYSVSAQLSVHLDRRAQNNLGGKLTDVKMKEKKILRREV